MKTKNIIITLSAATVLVVGILVACTKDRPVNTTIIDNGQSNLSPKDYTGNQQLLFDATKFYWMKCDSAYTDNSMTFKTACDNEDYTSFLAITNIPDSLVDSIIHLVGTELQLFLLDNPEYDYYLDECEDCRGHILSDFGGSVKEYCDILDDIQQLDPDFDRGQLFCLPPFNECKWRCYRMLGMTELQAHICYMHCLLEFNITTAREYFQALYDSLYGEEPLPNPDNL
ncbi:MAG: hypothetical protein J6X79_07045 [Bacteroidales bacterium]|nr:hypothetical protein [Bacteroidales bacterium]